MDAASPSPTNMLPYYKQMFAKSSPLTGPFGRRGPNRIHFRHHQEASTQKGGWPLGEGLGYGISLTERLQNAPVKDAKLRAPTQSATPTPLPRHLMKRHLD